MDQTSHLHKQGCDDNNAVTARVLASATVLLHLVFAVEFVVPFFHVFFAALLSF
jgi:hypothetical protein